MHNLDVLSHPHIINVSYHICPTTFSLHDLKKLYMFLIFLTVWQAEWLSAFQRVSCTSTDSTVRGTNI